MPNDGYMDAAAVPVPDAGDATLREHLAEAIKELLPVDPDDGTVVSEFGDFGPIWDTADEVSRGYADALLPLIREHVAAAVQGERGRLASGLDDMQEAYPGEPEVRRGLRIAKITVEKMWEADHA